MKTVYKATGMACKHCVQTITNKLNELDGVTGVEANLDDKSVAVESNKEVSLESLNNALDGTNYNLEK